MQERPNGMPTKRSSRTTPATPTKVSRTDIPKRLLADIRSLIESARSQTAQAINTKLVLLYWSIGDRIRRDILKQKRAEYGEKIVTPLASQLEQEYGRGFSRRNLFNMIRFAEVFSAPDIVQTLSAQLGWSHFLEITALKDPLQRDFYAEMCRRERWSVRTLRAKIGGLLYERTGLSKKPAQLAQQELAALRETDRLTPDLVFRDPYFLDFLGLHDTYSEKDLESAILREDENDPEIARLLKQSGNLSVTMFLSKGESRLVCEIIRQVRIGTCLKECLDGIEMAVAGGFHQGSSAHFVGDIGIHPAPQEQVDDARSAQLCVGQKMRLIPSQSIQGKLFTCIFRAWGTALQDNTYTQNTTIAGEEHNNLPRVVNCSRHKPKSKQRSVAIRLNKR